MTADPYVQCGDERRSLAEVKYRASQLATGLHNAGVGAGDRVVLYLRNETTFLELCLATAMIGAAPVPVNWHWSGDDLEHVLRDSKATVAVGHTDLMPALEARTPDEITLVEVEVPEAVRRWYGLDNAPTTGRSVNLSDWYRLEPWTEPAPSAPMSVIYTSGTTGRAKGVLRDPIAPDLRATTLRNIADLYHLKPGETAIVPAPLYHSAPNVYATFAAALGMSLIIMPRFDAEEFLRLVDGHHANTAHLVPTMFRRLLRLPKSTRSSFDTDSLHSVVTAGAPCSPELKESMIEWLGAIVYEYYGGSEVGAWTACDSEEALKRPGTVGKPILDADIRILDDEKNPVPVGKDGVVYGKNFTGWPDFTYIGDPDKRRRMEVDGYLTLGDIGHQDEDGYLYLSDRLNDMVVSGGVNIYPAEIEACISRLSRVADVAVFGIPDPDMGEALACYVQPVPGAQLDENEIREHVSSHLARYKVPRKVVFVDELPREDTGKLFKRKLKQKYWENSETNT
ncbi:AMP-binding protein [Nocardia donostiensis]|uniref:Long-chain fatty acid--CoA ligase n=1 Tax=Nocardia donostiensis TaxID=1538463 RepID=A0A1W0B7G3_9NOCA|nr:AMP-binding protein [Nocardia donostiensis]ONM46251.1 long-chain fatty acid--CoA ligase [Nocardia donostiensis]OQS13324.1 long-chain fatty acid--CoA ligase [Nocardia donostiensis]OQS18424.1 long-chain fatty acid--CoA ligase [Nocardia donostiensis]